MFRRTVPTAVNTNAGIELAAELRGHTDTTFTVRSELGYPGDRRVPRPGVREG